MRFFVARIHVISQFSSRPRFDPISNGGAISAWVRNRVSGLKQQKELVSWPPNTIQHLLIVQLNTLFFYHSPPPRLSIHYRGSAAAVNCFQSPLLTCLIAPASCDVPHITEFVNISAEIRFLPTEAQVAHVNSWEGYIISYSVNVWNLPLCIVVHSI